MIRLFSLFFLVLSTGIYAQTWENRESLPGSADERHHPVTFSIGSTGYLLTGAASGYESLTDFYAYNSLTDSWQEMADFPGGARGFSYGVSNGEKGYIGFGSFFNLDLFEFDELNDLWEYDPDTDTWTELASCPCVGRSHPAMVMVGDKIYVGLGEGEFGDLKDWWEYDISTDTWTEKTEFPSTERHHPYYFGIGDYAYVGFGHHTSSIFNDFYRYDPETDTWLALNDFPDQGRVAGTQFSYNGRGYILSGQGEDHSNLPTGEFWEYDPNTDEWIALLAHPNGGRWAPGSFVIGDEAYLACGQANTGEKRDLMVYNFGWTTEIEESVNHGQMLFPNPSTGIVYINQFSGEKLDINIYGTSGKLFLNEVTLTGSIDLTSLSSGVYFIEIVSGMRVETEKLIIE